VALPQNGRAPTAVGLDGCRAGWIAALAWAKAPGGSVRTELRLIREGDGGFASLVAECEATRPPPIIAVDVPIGLPTTAGLRPCDREARRRLGRRWMCVFPVPDREMFGLSFERAREAVLDRRGRAGGEGHPIMTRQAIAILPKIAEVDAAMRVDASRQEWIVEVHPELCFLALAARLGEPVTATGLPRKRGVAGRAARLALLRRVFPDVSERVDAAPWPRREVGRDDILDAYAALWTARRYAADPEGTARLGGDLDACGLVQRMVT
jgi:predicted RNase H-like nuclease